MTTIMVVPWELSSLRSSITLLPVFVSRLPVGSSAKRIGGELASALAIATLCCCPPESSLGLCSANSGPRFALLKNSIALFWRSLFRLRISWAFQTCSL